MNILSLLIKAAIFLYKICISPYIISSCRFVPSCSIDALTKLPTRIALMRIIKRILRCNPLNKDDRLDRA
jgi:putative membrane protein insertion efficiency factor